MSINRGDRIEVVLDVVRTEKSGIPFQRVFVRGVYPYGAGNQHPARYDGATRNEIGVFYGIDMGVPAFLIECPPENGEFTDAFDAALVRVRSTWADLFAGYGHGEMTTADAEEITRTAVEAAIPVIREQITREIRGNQEQPAVTAENRTR